MMSDLERENALAEFATAEEWCQREAPTSETDLSEVTKMSRAEPRLDFASLIVGIRVGVLIGLKDDGRIPLVTYPGQPIAAAIVARATLDLHGSHVGREVALMFENGDPHFPIILGCFPPKQGWPLADRPSEVEVDADGERLMVTAKEQLVLRCGGASITLTKAGKILMKGTYVSSRSSGLSRISGGSVQIN